MVGKALFVYFVLAWKIDLTCSHLAWILPDIAKEHLFEPEFQDFRQFGFYPELVSGFPGCRYLNYWKIDIGMAPFLQDLYWIDCFPFGWHL